MMMLDTVCPVLRKDFATANDVDAFDSFETALALPTQHSGHIIMASVASGQTLSATTTSVYGFAVGGNSAKSLCYLINAGSIVGKGGAGGAGGVDGSIHGKTGGTAGPALHATTPIVIDNTGGTVGGGTGGGGGTGAAAEDGCKSCEYVTGASGGAGANGGGATGAAGNAGASGCGSGGNAGAGGAAGNYINGTAFATWLVAGTRNGGVS